MTITISNDNNKISQIDYIKTLLAELSRQITPAQIKALKIDSVIEALPVYQAKTNKNLSNNSTRFIQLVPRPAGFKPSKVVLKKIVAEVNKLADGTGLQPSHQLLTRAGLNIINDPKKHTAKVTCTLYLNEAVRQGLISFWSARGQGRGKVCEFRKI